MNWYIAPLKKYAVFSGSARRKEYWMFLLCNIVISVMLGFVLYIVGISPEVAKIVSNAYILAITIPGIAVSVRRLHDSGRSGWWILINFIPVVGVIAIIVLMAQDSQQGDNKYGANPKLATA